MRVGPSRCQIPEAFTSRKSKKKSPEDSSFDVLPEEVLIIILSCLNLKEAARASVLSRRWRYLWRFRSSDIVFELEDRNAEDGSRIELHESMNLVNQVMALHQGPSLDKLVIRCSPMDRVGPDFVPFSDWIRFAMEKKVRVLEFPCFGSNFLDLDKFLSISRAMEPESSLASLNSFTLVDFDIKGEMIEYLLSICRRLEHLSLKGGKFSTDLSISSPSLKSFSICSCKNLRNLTIWAENLVSFAYMGHSPKLCFQNIPLVSELIMDGTYMHSFMFALDQRILHKQLVKLVLILSTEVIAAMSHFNSYRIIPCLRRVKHLELVITVIPDASLLFYVFWVMACPSLSTLYVQFYEQTSVDHLDKGLLMMLPYQRKGAQKRLNTYRHKHLKHVKLNNFVGHTSTVEFAMDLLQISGKSLEKLIINPKSDPDGIGLIDNYVERLEANLPAGAELVIQWQLSATD